VRDACSSRGATRPHCGHCRSSKTTRATCAPFGGRSASGTSSAKSGRQGEKQTANGTTKSNSRRIFIFYFGCRLNREYSYVKRIQPIRAPEYNQRRGVLPPKSRKPSYF